MARRYKLKDYFDAENPFFGHVFKSLIFKELYNTAKKGSECLEPGHGGVLA